MASPPERNSGDVGTTNGFQAHLTGVSVADLIQLSCLSNATNCVRVLSHGQIGWIHFSGGKIVHAATGTIVGDAAVLHMLQWIDGTLEPYSAKSPIPMSVRSTWQNLLLLSAQQRDELQHANVIPMTQRTPVDPHAMQPDVAAQSGHQTSQRTATQPPVSSVREASSTPFVRINASGRVVSSRGDVEELTALAAFSAHMGQMIADQLGLERLQGIEVRTKTSRTVVSVGGDGQVQATTSSKEEDLVTLRRSAGL